MVCDEIYLIDGSAYIYRAYHAIAPLNNSSGLPTHAVYGFTAILRRIIRERQPQCLAVAFDIKGRVFCYKMQTTFPSRSHISEELPSLTIFLAWNMRIRRPMI
jgi:DNA polymerase-1